MPKKLPYDNPVRLIRESLELTQPDFASELGISETHLQKIELGIKQASENLGAVFALKFGIDPASLQPRGQPRFLSGKTNRSAETLAAKLREWQGTSEHFEEESERNLTDLLWPKLKVLMQAAAQSGQGTVALNLLDRAAMKTAVDLGLIPAVQKLIAAEEKKGKRIIWEPYLKYASDQLSVQDGAGLEVRFVKSSRSKARKTTKV